MCYNVEYMTRKAEKLRQRYEKVLPPDKETPVDSDDLPTYQFLSGFSFAELPLVKHDGIGLYHWGLVPLWVKDMQGLKDIRMKTLNAVGETVFEKPSFRKSIVKQRGLLGINSFYEWRDFNGAKYPYRIKVKSEDIFSLGCIYETWVDKATGEVYNTFSILTTPANPMMEKVHNLKKRMPLILKKEDEARWVDPSISPDDIRSLIKPYDEQDMTAYTISKAANSTRNNRNVPEITEPVVYPELD